MVIARLILDWRLFLQSAQLVLTSRGTRCDSHSNVGADLTNSFNGRVHTAAFAVTRYDESTPFLNQVVVDAKRIQISHLDVGTVGSKFTSVVINLVDHHVAIRRWYFIHIVVVVVRF